MLPEEAKWLGRQIQSLASHDLFPMLNIGSSTGRFVSKEQPWIDEHVFGPMRRAGHQVLNCDIKAAPGVDLVGDLTDPAFLAQLSTLNIRSVMCSNLLEHVTNREQLGEMLSRVVPSGGYLFVTGPHSYPYHADPMDTLYRPTPRELAALFPGTQVVASDVVDCGTYFAYATRSPKKIVTTVARLFLPIYKPRDWVSAVMRLGWLNREFRAVCLVLKKL